MNTPSIEDLVRRHLLHGQRADRHTFQLLGTRAWARGIAAVCTTRRAHPETGQPLEVLSCVVLEQLGQEYQVVGSGGCGTGTPIPPCELVQYARGTGHTRDATPYTEVWGRILAREVAAVEVTFADGQPLRDEPRDGVFGFVVPGDMAARALHVFQADGQLLQHIALS